MVSVRGFATENCVQMSRRCGCGEEMACDYGFFLLVSLHMCFLLCVWTVRVFVCIGDDQEARNEGGFEARR